MIKNIKAITASSFLSMFFLGVASSLIGAAARNIGLSAFQIGVMLTAQNVGFMISVLISGALADTHSKTRILLIGSLILSISYLTFYLSGNFVLNLLIMLFIGVGIGSYEGVTDALLLDIHTIRESFFININHFFVTFGSIIITAYLLFLQMDWRRAVTQSGIVVLILAIIFALSRVEVKKKTIEPYIKRLQILAGDRIVVAFFIVTIIAVGVEGGTIGILTTYLMEMRGFDQVTSKVGLITFLVGVASGRVLFGYLTPKSQIPRYILITTGASVILFSALYVFQFGSWTYGLIFSAGLAISAILPMMLSFAGLLYKEIAGTVLGTIKIAIPLGGIILPFLFSILVKFASLRIALFIFPFAFLIAFIILLVTMNHRQVTLPISD